MAHTGLDTVEGAAKLVADVDIVELRDYDRPSPDTVYYDLTLSYGGSTIDVSFEWLIGLGGPSITDVFSILVRDANAFAYFDDIDDFADELGFTKPSQAISAYEEAKKAYNWLRDGVGLTEDEFDALCQTFGESEGAVAKAEKTIRAEREANAAHENVCAPCEEQANGAEEASLDAVCGESREAAGALGGNGTRANQTQVR